MILALYVAAVLAAAGLAQSGARYARPLNSSFSIQNMEITTQNLHHAENAIRDILFMFLDMIRSHSGFGQNLE